MEGEVSYEPVSYKKSLYSRYSEDWTWEQLVATDGRKRDLFGSSVALNENDELVVGASGRQGGKGAVYLYKFQGEYSLFFRGLILKS